MRWSASAVLACVLVIGAAAPAVACDPDWDWCGYDWYEPSWYEVPSYEEPATSWTWWEEPVYEPIGYEVPTYATPIYEPPPVYVPAYEPLPVYEPDPVYEAAPVYEPVVVYEPAPAYEPVPVIAAPSYVATPEPAPMLPASDLLETSIAPAAQPPALAVAVVRDPDAVAAAMGLHRVTEVWSGHTKTTEGPFTTFGSTSVAMDAGTSAKRIATVGTGEPSPYDALVLGGRMALSDGRLVQGGIYENYVWHGYDWIMNAYVFFQDDIEMARLPEATPPPSIATPSTPTVVTPPTTPIAPVTASAPTTTVPSAPNTTVASGPAFVAPLTGDLPSAAAPMPAPSGGSQLPTGVSQPLPRVIRAGVALAPQADPLGRVEVLRGRRVPLWVRATVDGLPARVVGWQLVSGELTALGPIGGSGDDPLIATWRSISGPGEAFSVRLRASVDVGAEGLREVDASIDVVVRSPALVE